MNNSTQNELISVIVPIYKVEKYLKKCVDSIINQTYTHLEIILVDDGSPDGCGDICDEFKTKDSRIKVVHKENGGLSDARNSGLLVATGAWIVFVDSDDVIEQNMIKLLYEAVVAEDAQLSWCSIREIDEEGNPYNSSEKARPVSNSYNDIKNDGRVCIYTNVQAEKQMYTVSGNQKCLVAWNKLYKRSLFKEDGEDILYPKGKVFEDGYTTYRLIYQASKIVEIDEELYLYRQRGGSIMASDSNINYLPALDGGMKRMAFYEKNGEKDLYKLELNLSIYSVIRFYGRVKKKEDKKELKRWFKIFYEDYFIKEKWPLAKRLRMRAFKIGYPCYKFVSGFESLYNRLRKKK